MCVTLRNGDEWILDLSGAQYGFIQPFKPAWEYYADHVDISLPHKTLKRPEDDVVVVDDEVDLTHSLLRWNQMTEEQRMEACDNGEKPGGCIGMTYLVFRRDVVRTVEDWLDGLGPDGINFRTLHVLRDRMQTVMADLRATLGH